MGRLTQRHIADHLDLSVTRVQSLLQDLQIDYRTSSLDEIRVAYIQYLRGLATGRHKSASAEPSDLQEERARLTKWQADLAELNYRRKLGELVEVVEVQAVVEREYAMTRTKLLALPAKLAPRLLGLDDPNVAQRIVQTDITEVCSELSADADPFVVPPPSGSSGGEPESDLGAAVEPDGQPVGGPETATQP